MKLVWEFFLCIAKIQAGEIKSVYSISKEERHFLGLTSVVGIPLLFVFAKTFPFNQIYFDLGGMPFGKVLQFMAAVALIPALFSISVLLCEYVFFRKLARTAMRNLAEREARRRSIVAS